LAAVRSAATVIGRRGRIGSDTVHRRLRSAGLRARRPYVGPILTQGHRAGRLSWDTCHRYWLLQHWHGVLLSDESRIHLRNADVAYVYGVAMVNLTDVTKLTNIHQILKETGSET